MQDYKPAILENLKAMQVLEYKNKQPFKARAYSKVIKQLQDMHGPIKSMDDLASLTGVGDGIHKKLVDIFEQGYLEVVRQEKKSLEHEAEIAEFTKIMAVGPVKARELVEKHNIKSIEELRNNVDLLNDKQQLGLKYFEDFEKRIPRAEMDRHLAFIAEAIPTDSFRFEIAGSYRRGTKDSGDIDVLITSRTEDEDPEEVKRSFQEIIKTLKDKKYLSDEFGFGGEKYLGVARLPRFRTHRRIDILYIARDKFAFALLYFTGSQNFNIKMRNTALEKGYSLSEHGLKYSTGPRKGTLVDGSLFTEERDIFKFLEMEYVEPTQRK